MNKNKLLKSLFISAICVALFSLAFAADDKEEKRGIQVVQKNLSSISDDFGDYHAIIIGINNYEFWPKLKTAVKDAEGLGQRFSKDYGFKSVTLLTDKTPNKPTSSNILGVVRKIASSLSAKDNLLIYYAGHGHIDELTEEGYWIPIEGKLSDISTWIPHSQVKNLLETQRVKVKNLLMIADSCYSGTLLKRGGEDDAVGQKEYNEDYYNKLKEKASRKSREVITSGGNEPVEDALRGGEHSLFAHYLLKALDENQKRYIDVATLFNQEIQNAVNVTGKQMPERTRIHSGADDGGLFILAKVTAPDIIKEKRINYKEELERLKALNEALIAKEKQKEREIAEKDRQLAAERKTKEEEKNRIIAKLEEDKRNLEQDRNTYENQQKQLMEDKQRLAAAAEKNRMEEEKLKALLLEKEKDSNLKSEKIAEIEKEAQRIAAERNRIEAEKQKLSGREQLQSEFDAKLKEEAKNRELKEKEEAARVEQLKQEVARLSKEKEELKKEYEFAKSNIGEAKREIDFELIKNRFEIRDDGTAIDKQTNLIWLMDANYPMFGKTWEDAMKYCENLKYAGLGGWRLPTKEEWKTLVGKGGVDKTFPQGHPFRNIMKRGVYWSSSFNPIGPTHSYSVNAANGGVSYTSKTNIGYVWPVRFIDSTEVSKTSTDKK